MSITSLSLLTNDCSFCTFSGAQKEHLAREITSLTGEGDTLGEWIEGYIDRIFAIIAREFHTSEQAGERFPSQIVFSRRNKSVTGAEAPLIARSFALLDVPSTEDTLAIQDSDAFVGKTGTSKCLLIMLNRTQEGDELLGEGGSKKVKRGLLVTCRSGEFPELKVVALSSQITIAPYLRIDAQSSVDREVEIHKLFGKYSPGVPLIGTLKRESMKHPVCFKQTHIFELADTSMGPDLAHYTDHNPTDFLEVVRALFSASRALCIIHRNGCVYLDFKDDQILLLPGKRWKLTDFEGVMTTQEIADSTCYVPHNLLTCSPELALINVYRETKYQLEGATLPILPDYKDEDTQRLLYRHDVWSLGITLLQKFSIYPFYEDSDDFGSRFLGFTTEPKEIKDSVEHSFYRLLLITQFEVDKVIEELTFPHAKELYYRELVGLLRHMLQVDPKKRMKMEDVVLALEKLFIQLVYANLRKQRPDEDPTDDIC